MRAQHVNHRSYLVRLWQDHPGAPWRVTLISVAYADNSHHFADLESLFAFLLAQTGVTAWLGPEEQTAGA